MSLHDREPAAALLLYNPSPRRCELAASCCSGLHACAGHLRTACVRAHSSTQLQLRAAEWLVSACSTVSSMACVQAPKRRVQERRGKREGTLVSKASRAALHTDSGSLRRNTLLDAHDPMNSNPQVQQPRGPKLKFCPESNDLLYPKVCTPPLPPVPAPPPACCSLRGVIRVPCCVVHTAAGFQISFSK